MHGPCTHGAPGTAGPRCPWQWLTALRPLCPLALALPVHEPLTLALPAHGPQKEGRGTRAWGLGQALRLREQVPPGCSRPGVTPLGRLSSQTPASHKHCGLISWAVFSVGVQEDIPGMASPWGQTLPGTPAGALPGSSLQRGWERG